MEPKIRLKGFCGEWKETALGDLCSVNRGVRVTRKELNTNGNYPVYQNTDYPMGFYSKSNVKANNPFVILGGSAGLIGFSKVDFWAADDCAYFGDSDNLDKNFLYNALSNHSIDIKKNVRGSSVPRLDRKVLMGLKVSLPPTIEEQKSVGAYLDSIDSLIQSTTKKIESLKQVKAASLQAMFPQEGETTPRVRFQGFEGEWSIWPLKGFAKKSTEKNTTMDYTITLTNSAEYGVINQRDFFDHDISNDEHINGYYVIHNDDFVYNPRVSASAPVGPINRNLLGYSGVMSPLYLIFKVNGINKDFLSYYFKTTLWHNYMKLEGNTGARFDRLAISDEQFFNMPIYVPKDEIEQKKVADYFANLDSQITLQNQRLEKLKQIKSACLDNMFV